MKQLSKLKERGILRHNPSHKLSLENDERAVFQQDFSEKLYFMCMRHIMCHELFFPYHKFS